MHKAFKTILFIFAIFFCSYSFSQNPIKGKVIDSKTKLPLAFVNIIFNSNLYLNVTTDIDGKFYFNKNEKVNSLTCSYLGYEKLNINIDSIKKINKEIIIELTPSSFNLQEVIIKPGENPANRIIKKVIENKDINNPENISSFKYTSYNKTIYDIMPNDSIGKDSLKIKLDKFFKGGHLLIMESVSERKFIAPDINEEIITGTKVSGFKHPTFASLATDIQPFSFYKDIITMLEVKYLNPISNGSLNKYQFNITDTLYQNTDTVFVISFKPLPGKNFDGLSGLLYINTNKFAIQNVIAESFDKGFINIKIQQQYTFLENKYWFPNQLNFEMQIKNYPSKKIGMSANGKSYIENVELLPNIDKKDFSIESLKMDDFANDRDSTFWNNNRTKNLNNKEKATYQVMDSVGEKAGFDLMLRLMEKLSQNRIPISIFDLDISNTLVYNKFEGNRYGLGAYTNEKVLKHFIIGGFFGYGSKDYQWKYGGEFILTLNKNKEFTISGKHQNTLIEAGHSDLNFFIINSYDYRTFMASRMDKLEQNSFSIGFRFLRYAKLDFTFKNTLVSPQYIYEYQPNNLQKITNYINSDLTINLKYAFREKLINSLNQLISMGTNYPILYLSYSKGIKYLFNSEFDYNKVEARIEKSFFTKNIGETKFRIDGGFIDKPLPYGLLFTSEGSLDKNTPILIKNSFQTVSPYEFLSDRYVNLYFSHNFGSLLFQIKKFKPHFTLYQNIGWGMLSNSEYHKSLEFKTKEKGFYESGLQIDNIIKINILNISYMGLGVGAYYRYGPYSYINYKDNLAVKFSITYGSK